MDNVKNEKTTDFQKTEEERSKKEVDRLWKEIGWHRPLGGMLYNYLLLLVVMLPGILVVSVVVPNLFIPYPKSVRFSTIASS